VKPLVVDAGVLVSAADASDAFSAASRAFLDRVAARSVSVDLPAHARLELSCALARRVRRRDVARRLADGVMRAFRVTEHALDAALIEEAVQQGTKHFLRAGDALYAALAERLDATLVTWDAELLERAGGVSPQQWEPER